MLGIDISTGKIQFACMQQYLLILNCPRYLYTYTGCPKKTPKTIENDLLLEFQCLALN